jgi:hypothetical protein
VILPLCLNHAGSPGEVWEVHPCECCRNYQARQEPYRGIEPPPGPEVKYIPLGNRQYAIVDAADFDWLNRHTWHVMGGQSVLGYAYRYEHGKKIFMHREVMQTPAGLVADHKNHNPINNRRCNLRNCKPQENQRNRRRRTRNQSGYVGVYPHGKKWLALVFSGGKVVYREVFDDKIEAAKARDRKAYEFFGPFAYLNFPEEILGSARERPPAGWTHEPRDTGVCADGQVAR